MGKCKFCGERAGWFRKEHKACREKHQMGQTLARDKVRDAILEDQDYNSMNSALDEIAGAHFLRPDQIQRLKVLGFNEAVDHALDDHLLSAEEEKLFGKFLSESGLSKSELNTDGKVNRLVQAAALRDLSEGKIPTDRLTVNMHLPFNFQKSEELIWVFADVEFYEQRTRTEFTGGHQGVSFRVTKGVYYRTGSFRGRPIKVEEMRYIDTGVAAITTRHFYFSSSSKNFRTRIDRIVTLDPYEDGIGMQKEGVSSRPQIFKNVDGWFTYNVISHLNQL